MKNTVKTILYVVAVTCTVIFGAVTIGHYRDLMDASAVEEPGLVDPAQGGENKPSKKSLGSLMTSGFLAFGSLVGLALLVSRDASRFLAHRAERFMFSDDGEGMRDPEYERAEQVWADGKFLEAIQLMRDFLKQHPRELHAALRIAEIYEKDLGNHLAAALEYEEVIKHNLPPERWGWAAIHLANLYSGKLNRTEQAMELLHRIVNEYGQTAAAKKARERLSLDEPPQSPGPPPDQPDSNLPPGFSLKR